MSPLAGGRLVEGWCAVHGTAPTFFRGRISANCATPLPGGRISAKCARTIAIPSQCRTVLPYVITDPAEMVRIADQRVIMLTLPDGTTRTIRTIDAAGRKALERRQSFLDKGIEGQQQDVQVIGHDNEGVQTIASSVIRPQRILNRPPRRFRSERTRSLPCIKPLFDHHATAAEIIAKFVARRICAGRAPLLVKSAQLIQTFARKRTCRPDRDKGRNASLLPMRQIAAPDTNVAIRTEKARGRREGLRSSRNCTHGRLLRSSRNCAHFCVGAFP